MSDATFDIVTHGPACDVHVTRGLDCHECGHSLTCEECCTNAITPCDTCGYVMHDVPTSQDNAHDNLCCGSGVDGCREAFVADGLTYLCEGHMLRLTNRIGEAVGFAGSPSPS